MIVGDQANIGPIGKLTDNIDEAFLNRLKLLVENAQIDYKQVTLPVLLFGCRIFELESGVLGHEFMRQLAGFDVLSIIGRHGCEHSTNAALDGFGIVIDRTKLTENSLACTG